MAQGQASAVALLLHPFEDGSAAATAERGSGAAVVVSWEAGSVAVVHSSDLREVAAAVQQLHLDRSAVAKGAALQEHAGAEDAAALGHQEQHSQAVLVGGRVAALAPTASSASAEAQGQEEEEHVPLKLRLLLDGSCLELFTSSGEALATRVYRAPPSSSSAQPAAAATGACAAGMLSGGQLELLAFGSGTAQLVVGNAWQVASMWQQQQAAAAAPLPTSAHARTPEAQASRTSLSGVMPAAALDVAAPMEAGASPLPSPHGVPVQA